MSEIFGGLSGGKDSASDPFGSINSNPQGDPTRKTGFPSARELMEAQSNNFFTFLPGAPEDRTTGAPKGRTDGSAPGAPEDSISPPGPRF